MAGMKDREALFYEKDADGKVRCHLCRHDCLISPGKRGICQVRENRGGILYSLNYGRIVAAHVDPIEKKPLYHFLPGTRSFSIASAGCNFRCGHCQNYSIAQAPRDDGGRIPGEWTEPGDVVRAAARSGSKSIAYTYTEPTIYYEFAEETARRAVGAGLRNVFVSNGYTGAEAIRRIAPVLHGINVDLKAFSDRHYREICGARLEPVLENIRLLHSLGIWVEVTTLIIPGLNDSEETLRSIAEFICSVDPEIPWHVSRFHPSYRMLDRPPTPLETVQKARKYGILSGLHYVYTGNVHDPEGNDTSCPGCRTVLLTRRGFDVSTNRVSGATCPECGLEIAGFWPPAGTSDETK